MKRLVDELVAVPREKADGTAEQLRAWAIEGWLPTQAKKRALWTAIEAARPAASDPAGAALLEGRAMESLADDWTNLHDAECGSDPTMCKIAMHVAENARQAWIERARERYQACVAFASEDSDKEDFCSARDDALRKPRR